MGPAEVVERAVALLEEAGVPLEISGRYPMRGSPGGLRAYEKIDTGNR